MNYFEWSQEYKITANQFSAVIEKLKSKRKNASTYERKEIDTKIAKYKTDYYECLRIAELLMKRYRGVA